MNLVLNLQSSKKFTNGGGEGGIWMDGQGKIHKSGWKVEEKKAQCDGTAEGGMRGVGEGKGRSGRDLRLTHTI